MFSLSLILLLLTTGSCVYCIDLIQPDSKVVQPGQSLIITCRPSGYSLTDNNYATGWIRHREGKPMEWIFHMWGGGGLIKNDALKNKFSYSRDTSAGTVTITGQNLQPEDAAVYYCVRRRGDGAFDYWGDGTTVTVRPDGPSQTPSLFVLSPLSNPDSPLKSADELGPNVCLATGFRPKGGEVVVNQKGGPVNVSTDDAVMSKDGTYNYAVFSNETIYSCGMNGTFGNNEADDECGSIYPEKAKLNFYLLLMNGVRVVFTKALAFSTVLTIRGLIF